MGPMGLNRGVALLCFLVTVVCALGAHTARAASDITTQLRFRAVERVLLEEKDNSSESLSEYYTKTERIDPLDNFKKYRGGYNITNKHYWSSVIFTGKYGYGCAAIWLVNGFICSMVLLIRAICFTNKGIKDTKRLPCTKRDCFWPFLIGFFLTLSAIIASGVVLGGSSRFHSRATQLKNIVVETAKEASGTIYNVTNAVRVLQEDTELYGILEGSNNLNSTLQKLNDDAENIERKAEKNMRLVNKGLKILNTVTIVTVALNLIVILTLLASQPLKLRRAFSVLIVLCWLFTCLFWVYFGLYFFLNKFADDTCTALDDYQQDPQKSSLGSILPCNDQISAKLVLRDTGAGIHDIIDQVNANISKVQSYLPGLEYVCNPFSGPPEYIYQPQNCSSNTIQVGDIPQILKRYACTEDGGTCKQGEFISASEYSKVLVYTSFIQNILNSFPHMESLVDCQLVKDAFSDILFKQCKPLKKYGRMTWVALLVLSTIMVALILLRLLDAYCYGRQDSCNGSVKPHSTPTDGSEADANEKASKPMEP